MQYHNDPFRIFMGTTGQLIRAYNQNSWFTPQLFKPYDSSMDFGFRVSSIVTAPFMSSLMCLGFAAYAGFWLLVGETDEAKECASMSVQFLVGVVTSSLVNLIDLIGSAATTLGNEVVNSFS